MKTRSCNFDNYTELSYSKTGFQTRKYTFFASFFLLKIDYGCAHILFLSQEKQQQNDHNFHVKIVIYTVVKIQD